MQKAVFVINPNAGQGRSSQRVQKALNLIKKRFDAQFLWTKGPNDAEKFTKDILLKPKKPDLIVAVGGDGTVSECINGFFKDKKLITKKTAFGVLPGGRGCDFSRTLGLERDFEKAIEQLYQAKQRPIDVGYIDYDDFQKRRYFLNIAEIGFGAFVCDHSAKAPHFLGAKGSYLWGIFAATLAYRPPQMTFYQPKGALKIKKSMKVFNFVIANGQYFGSNMKVAPYAKIDDGKLNLVIFPKMALPKLLKILPKVQRGEHLKSPSIFSSQTPWVEVHADKKVPFEADGDSIATLPARFGILEKQIKIQA